MLLDFSINWQWIIGGTDVSPHVETWELSREQPDMGTPAWWRGKLVLRPVVGRNLNLDPLANSLWRQGTRCSLTVGGSLVFTGSILLAYYDDWSTEPRLELEVGDVLAAKNHRQVIPFGEYNALSLLRTLGIPGDAPAGDKVEISTDLTSPVKVLQELTWVAWLKERGLPATLYTRPDGQVDYASPQKGISLTRTLEQVSDFTRQRPALEIPGSVVASASLTYLVLNQQGGGGTMGPPRSGNRAETVLVTKEGDAVKVTYLDSFGRVEREEVYRGGALDGYAEYQYRVDSSQYEITKSVFIRVETDGYITYSLFERIKEIGRKVRERQAAGRDSDLVVYGRVVAEKKTFVYWPGWRFFPLPKRSPFFSRFFLAYVVEEYGILGRLVPRGVSQVYSLVPDLTHLLRIVTRSKGTTQDTESFEEAITLSPSVSELIPNQEIQFPGWVKQFWDPPKPEKITDALSEEATVAGFTGPPVYLTVPWLSITAELPPGVEDFQQQIESLRQSIRRTLRAAARWMATEIAGRAFARRIKMPPPPEWLGNPRPWTLARIGDEVLWLVGETLRGTAQGVEFEATGILAGRPSTIPPGQLPPGTIPDFIPLITVAPTRFPQVGIGCMMGAGEAVFIQGDPWLGMAVEIEHAVSVAEGFAIGIGWMGIPAAELGFAVDATHEITGDEDEDNGDVEGITLEAEDGSNNFYNIAIVYDQDASSCYAMETQGGYSYVEFYVDSTDLTWARPLRIRVIYKATDEGNIYVYTIQGGSFPYVGYSTVSATTGYSALEFVIPTNAEPFDGIVIDMEGEPGTLYLDAIQLAPATGDWPPLNPCEGDDGDNEEEDDGDNEEEDDGDNEEEDDGDDTEIRGLTLEAEDGEINNGFIVYDRSASSCYAVTTEFGAYAVDFSVNSDSLDWVRPLKLLLIYKATGYGEIVVYRRRGAGNFVEMARLQVSPTTSYITRVLTIPTQEEPFDGFSISVIENYPDKIYLDAIQLVPATGVWPPTNPCTD